MRRLKTVRRPPIYPNEPSHLPCSSLTHPAAVLTPSIGVLRWIRAKEPPREMSHDELEALYAPLETIRATLPKLPQMGEPLTNATFSIFDKEAFLNGYAGWQRLTLEGVLAMPRRGFQLDDLLRVCEPMATTRYPENRHVRAKLRQQLQMLRDVGIVEFMGGGRYRFTMESG